MKDEFIRSATVERVIDGDTLILLVDLGYSVYSRQHIRLKDVNCPEVVGKDKAKGLEASAFLFNLLPKGTQVIVHSFKQKKSFDRYVADVYLNERNIADILVEEGHGTRL